MTTQATTIAADIGGTNARFAQVSEQGSLRHVMVLAALDHPSVEDAIRHYLETLGLSGPVRATLAVATPISQDTVTFTNSRWSFSCEGLLASLNLRELLVINDYTALALAVPHLTPDAIHQVGAGQPMPNAAVGVLGPGTGLGMSGLVRFGKSWVPLAGEGGHATLAATTGREREVLNVLAKRYGHVSGERVLSGNGLANLYQAVCALEGWEPANLEAADVTRLGISGEDRAAREALELFCAFLGVTAGNLALTLGAHGGIYLGGGILPRLGEFLDHSRFRARFEAKGRYSSYLSGIPTFVVQDPTAGIQGARIALETTTVPFMRRVLASGADYTTG